MGDREIGALAVPAPAVLIPTTFPVLQADELRRSCLIHGASAWIISIIPSYLAVLPETIPRAGEVQALGVAEGADRMPHTGTDRQSSWALPLRDASSLLGQFEDGQIDGVHKDL